MEKLIRQFPHAYIRDFLGGKEFRVRNLDEAIKRARDIIQKNNLQIEIFDVSASTRSFSVREIKSPQSGEDEGLENQLT